jgi:hypothetical protein
MNDPVVVEKMAQWQRLKALVLDSVSSPITRRVYAQRATRIDPMQALPQE